MSPYTPADDSPAGEPMLGAAAQQEWNDHVESVLRGVAHALNNRAAALAALIQLAEDSEPAITLRGILESELERVGGLTAAIRSIGSPRGGDEAFAPADAAAEAMAVLKLHADQREVATRIEARGAPPIRVRRALFVRALIVLGANAGRAGAQARVELTAAGDDLLVRVDGATPQASPFVRETAPALGGEALDDGRGLRLPSLAALRRREGS